MNCLQLNIPVEYKQCEVSAVGKISPFLWKRGATKERMPYSLLCVFISFSLGGRRDDGADADLIDVIKFDCLP